MPSAVVSTDVEKKDLETLEGAYVELKRMSFGAFLKRQDIMMRMSVEQAEKGQKDSAKMNMSMGSVETTLYEFQQCVVGHNLEDEDGNKLDITKAGGLQKLDPKVGQEISDLIEQMNQHLSPDHLGN